MKDIDLHAIKKSFVQELIDSSDGLRRSMPFIRQELSRTAIVSSHETFQVLVIGGSVYQKALMKKVHGNIRILEYEQDEQPAFLTEEDLMKFIEKHLDPHVKKVALNFAYPLEPVTRGDIVDGRLQSGSKENTFDGLVGKVLGETVEKHIKKTQDRDIEVAAANDTICLLLSGLMHNGWDRLAAGIVGTGLNFAIFLDQHTAVNLESANFDKFPQSDAGIMIDEDSVAPGDALYEKEISGAYLYKHFNYLIQVRNLPTEPIRSTKDLEVLVRHKDPEIAEAAQEVIEHSASLVAIQIAGIMDFAKRDINFIMQGSLYWKGFRYKEIVERIVIDLCPDYRATYEQVLHSDLFGAAKLIA